MIKIEIQNSEDQTLKFRNRWIKKTNNADE